jgi:predicted nucleotidyltransferase
MNLFYPEHITVLKALLHHHVRFLLIGGYAVISHGYMRTTGDLDLWIAPDDENKIRLLQSFLNLGFEETDLEPLNEMDFTEPQVFSIGTVPQKIDFLTRVNILQFDEAYQNKMEIDFDGLVLPIVHYQDLVLMKMTSERTKDKADVEELQKIFNQKKKQE